MALHYSHGRAPSQSTTINQQLSNQVSKSCTHLIPTQLVVQMSPSFQKMSTDQNKHSYSRGLYVVTAGTLLLHEEGSRSASLQGCGDAQLADQQDSKQLELLFNYERASQAQQPAAPRQNIQQQSPSSQLDPNDMHYFPSSPARQQNKSSAILQSRGNQRLAFVEGCSDQANQEQLHQKSVGGCALPVETCPQDTSEVIAGKARSSLKGSSAWPPPSPSPKKPLPSPKKPSAYPTKAACSQNRQPARGLQLQGVSQAATLQRHTDVMALRQRLRYVVMMAAVLLNMPAAKSTTQSRALIANVQFCRMHHTLPLMLMLPFTQLF